MIEFTEWAEEILSRTHQAARRFNQHATIRAFRKGGTVVFALTDAPEATDRRIDREGFVLVVEEGLEGTVDVVEPHDQLVLRPPGDPRRSARHDPRSALP